MSKRIFVYMPVDNGENRPRKGMSLRIAIFGATRGVGLALVEQATAQGHECRVLAREPDVLHDAERLKVISGNVLDPDAVQLTLEGCDCAVVSLSASGKNPKTICADGTQIVIDKMKELGVPRLVAITSLGLGESEAQVPWQFRGLMKTLLRNVMQDKARQEEVVRSSGLDWTIVRPSGLWDGPHTGDYRTGTDSTTLGKSINRGDVAHFVLKELSEGTYLHQTPWVMR